MKEELLRSRYFFDGAELRPCDEWLAAYVCGEEAQRAKLPQIIACNRAADEAWSKAQALRAAADTNSDEDLVSSC